MRMGLGLLWFFLIENMRQANCIRKKEEEERRLETSGSKKLSTQSKCNQRQLLDFVMKNSY